MKLVQVFAGLFLFSVLMSCGMSWDNGGEEEFREKMEKRVKREYRDDTSIEPDVDKTCDCLVKLAKVKNPNYGDSWDRNGFFEAYVGMCLEKK